MEKFNNIQACKKIFLNAKSIIISTHTNPDGDALGSSLALHRFALKIGKSSRILADTQLSVNLALFNQNEYEVYDYTKHVGLIENADAIFILDLNDSKRLKSLEKNILESRAKKVMIDHHLEPNDFADAYYVDTDASSTAELVFKFIKNLDVAKLDNKIAEALYLGIMTDSGSFRFPRTDAELHRIVAELIEFGADPVSIYDNVYNQNSLLLTKLVGEVMTNIRLYCDDKLCIMTISRELLKKYKATNQDLEGFVEKTLSVAGVQIGAMISEMEDKDEIRISLRSKGDYSVREIAMYFGGGGHFHASGARCYECSLDDAKSKIVELAAKQIYS